MADLDFSGLSDDQLLGLVRAALQEAVRRHPAMAAAAEAACLDEAEKAKVAVEAAGREAAAGRARERERVAAEAAAKVRASQAAQNAEAEARRLRAIAEAEEAERAAKVRAKAAADVAETARREARHREFLLRAAALVDRPPGNITLVVYAGSVFINEGEDRYSREHLVEYRGQSLEVRRALVGRRAELLPFCAELRATYREGAIVGSAYFPRIKQSEEGGAA